MTAVSAIVFFLGLLFGFQRPSRLLLPRLCATVLLLLSCTPFNPGAAFFISKRLFCQAAVAAPFHRFASPGFNTAPSRFVSSGRGARNLLPFRISCQLASSTLSSTSLRLCRLRYFAVSRGGGFYHRRVRSQPTSSPSSSRSRWFVGRSSPTSERGYSTNPRTGTAHFIPALVHIPPPAMPSLS